MQKWFLQDSFPNQALFLFLQSNYQKLNLKKGNSSTKHGLASKFDVQIGKDRTLKNYFSSFICLLRPTDNFYVHMSVICQCQNLFLVKVMAAQIKFRRHNGCLISFSFLSRKKMPKNCRVINHLAIWVLINSRLNPFWQALHGQAIPEQALQILDLSLNTWAPLNWKHWWMK